MSTLAIDVDRVSKSYLSTGDYLGFRGVRVPAVRGVSLAVPAGSAFGVVGQSGSGKSSLARLIVGLEAPDSGGIRINGEPVPDRRHLAWRSLRRHVQIVFQDPYTALNPLMRVGASIAEPLINLTSQSRDERDAAVVDSLAAVHLPQRMIDAYPHQLSGGERQRVCIARALVLRPQVLVCDEAVSALDAQTQVQIVELLRELQQVHRLTYFFISHDIAIVSQLCADVAVMHEGEIVESGTCERVLQQPAHPTTRALLQAAMYFQQGRRRL